MLSRPLRAVYPLCRPRDLLFLRTANRCISYGNPGHVSPVDLWKYPRRGGRNLSDRYHRLEKTLRGKESFSRKIRDQLEVSTSVPLTQPLPLSRRESVSTFRGFVIPEIPRAPEPDECCMSGCAICVHDLYQESLQAYDESVAILRSSLTASNIPEREWPRQIRISDNSASERARNPVMSAFEEMERALRERREQRLQAEAGANMGTSHSSVSALKPIRRRVGGSVDIASLYEGIRWVIFSNR